MAITLANYYEQYANGDTTGLYSQPGGITIPNPNDPNNNNAAKYQSPGGTLTNDPAPLITSPVTKRGGINELAGSGFSALGGGAGLFALQTADSLLGRLTENLAAGAVDTARISKFFYTTPQGIAFNLKQVGLQRMNTKVPHGSPWGDNLPITKLLNDPQIYNLGINLLTQIPLEAIDIHIERHGAFPHFKEYPNNQGVYSQWFANNQDKVDSSLRSLYGKLDPPPVNGLPNVPIIDWFSYNGGPKSIFGIGNTSHRRWINTTDAKTNEGYQPGGIVNNDLNPTSTNLPVINIISSTSLSSGLPKTLRDLDNENLSLFKNASIGRVSKRNSNERKKLNITDNETIDQINYIGLLRGPKSDNLGKIVSDLVDKDGTKKPPDTLPKDLIKFRFEAINNDDVGDSIFIFFRAFLSGINDRYTPTWNPNQYVGRGEKFYIYDGFQRDISFNFSIAAQTRDEIKPLIQKLNFLASNTAPDYNIAGRMRGSFMRLTIGDYFVSLPGFISSLTYTLRDDSPWDIALYKNVEDEFGQNERELPHMIDVSVSYTPIHDFLPKKGTNDVFYMLGKGDEWITQLPKMNEDWIKKANETTTSTENQTDNIA